MAKPHRGKGIRELFAHGRGTCPVCGATGIKILYEHDAGGQKIMVCKPCKAAIKHGKKSLPKVEAATETAEVAEATTEAVTEVAEVAAEATEAEAAPAAE